MSTLGLLPLGSPDDPHSGHLVAPPVPAPPNFGFLYRPVGLSQREEDALRIHVLLLFYEDHALLWSSLEQHFHGFDEKRLNAAIAYLEEADAVEVEPAPAPNPWSPDDALVRLIPHQPPFPPAKTDNSSESNLELDRTLPLPWPGSHVYSPVVPATPGPPPFGFPVLLSETDYHAEQASEFPFPGSVSAGAAAFSSGRAASVPQAGGRRRSGAASRGTIPGLTITQINPATDQGSLTPRAMLSATPTTNPSTGISTFPSFDLLRLQSTTTVTPPSSDRWMSEENSPWLPAADDAGEQGWMNKRLGQAMSGVDYLDLDQVRDQAGGIAQEVGKHELEKAPLATTPSKTVVPRQPHEAPLSYEMDDTLDIVKQAMAAKSQSAATSSSRTSSKKGRERTGLGVSFANADEINEFHPPRSYEQNHATGWEEEDDDEEAAEGGHAKTPIPNPGSGWMRRLEKAYSYG
ncbi:hypothetical protein QFC22_000727 [Naganishia vaughanmartiniae]|uniref:Uncharacterized protein n=1 Tax=Naganishia vaughanmartiniae TaxID=1424756 RepID=A0ACC2XJW0_9TREE|nr:hypothetical protein QFC22_000727 [Naganishia vaughanmartiniae]